jgi:hypothetical protein
MNDRKFDEMLSVAEAHAQQKIDYVTPVAQVWFADDGALVIDQPSVVGAVSTRLPMTQHALTQVFARLGKAVWPNAERPLPSDFMLDIPADWRALNLNRAARAMPEARGWTVRSWVPDLQMGMGDVPFARAVMDQFYFPFDNDKMLAIVGEVLREKAPAHRISPQSFVKPDEMRVDVLIGEKQTDRPDAGGNAAWQWGVGLKNSEIGRGSGGAYAIIKRHSCDNSIAVDMDGYNYSFRHWAKKEELRNLRKNELYTAIANILPFGVELIERMVAADFETLPNFGEIIEGMTIQRGWSPEFVGQVWLGSEGNRSVAGVINGVTNAAQKVADPVARFDLELLGGAILVAPDSVFSPALQALEMVEREKVRAAQREVRRQARA